MADQQKVLTQAWYDKLVQELEDLKKDKLPAVLVKLKDAIGQWDISENAEYETAMWEKDLIEARINEIETFLNDVQILDEKAMKKWGEIKYNSQVVLEDEKWRQYEVRIVGTWEVDILGWTVSFDSPLGSAIKGKKVGDEVNVRSPRWRYKLKILKVK